LVFAPDVNSRCILLQFDIGTLIIGVVLLFIGGAVTAFFGFIYRKSGGVVLSRYSRSKNEFRVDVTDCVHMEEQGKTIYSMDLKLYNNTPSTMRVDDVSIVDKKGRKLEFTSRAQISRPSTEFEILGNDDYTWYCFCLGQPTGDVERVKLKVLIERKGHRTLKKNIVSTLVTEGKFPSGYIIWTG
jgi:hypothetical protein